MQSPRWRAMIIFGGGCYKWILSPQGSTLLYVMHMCQALPALLHLTCSGKPTQNGGRGLTKWQVGLTCASDRAPLSIGATGGRGLSIEGFVTCCLADGPWLALRPTIEGAVAGIGRAQAAKHSLRFTPAHCRHRHAQAGTLRYAVQFSRVSGQI
jgi:hypothetical protein